MNGRGYGLAEVGLFLLLAFVLPGFVYLAFLLFLFPNMFSQMVTTTGFTNNEALFGVLLGIIGGLLLTSVCFFLELFLSWIKLFWLMERVLRKVRIVGREWLLFPNMEYLNWESLKLRVGAAYICIRLQVKQSCTSTSLWDY